MKINIERLDCISNHLQVMLIEIEKRLDIEPMIIELYWDDELTLLKAVDIRAKNPEIAGIIVDFVNRLWMYDQASLDTQCAIYRDIGKVYNDPGNEKYIHLRVHPNTILRN